MTKPIQSPLQTESEINNHISAEQPIWEAAELIYTVQEEEAGILLRTVLLSRLHMSRRLITRLKKLEHAITVNGTRTYSHKPLEAGDIVRIRIAEPQLDTIEPEPIAIDVLFEDDDILVVHKPAGIVVHPTKGYSSGTLANGVVHYWRSRGEHTRFRPVHRLDQETSGVLVIAKHAFAHQQLSEQMKRNQMVKRYIAFTEGVPQLARGTVNAPIDRDPDEPHMRIVTPAGYDSITHYDVVNTYGTIAAKVECELETGRTHQIRVHMQHLGCPLIGDKFYNQDSILSIPMTRHALHAAYLSFDHPMSGEKVVFTAPLPAELEQLEMTLSKRKETSTQ
ncbi:RluA family pseudouridine synthase [Paenibacillus taiwanensis]|uniref:RluA family pseudouridine synthase n=1 Tax=Paenibacillus taiwanensis TaxID=401638 RepID=UPI00042A6D8A|nr:RluA family pseudouridine synthase [Paenibacillus taiwanensis]